jgi:hypothetical protein
METIPQIVTHNYDPAAPFLANLCSLTRTHAERALQTIRDSGLRTIKANYLDRRLATEAWLIRERHRLLGNTRLPRPIYFFLGNYADGKDPSRPSSLVMPLSAFPNSVITLTYPDSMTSHSLATREDRWHDRMGYHGRVYTLSEIPRVVQEFGMPFRDEDIVNSRRFDRFIEMQVWDDRPILEFLAPR